MVVIQQYSANNGKEIEMKKNKVTKVMVVLSIVVVMLFGTISVAFAGESVNYGGKCQNYFISKYTLTKINDTHLSNQNAEWGDYYTYPKAGRGTCQFIVGGTYVSTSGTMGQFDYHEWHDPNRRYTGTCQIRINNLKNYQPMLEAHGTFSVF